MPSRCLRTATPGLLPPGSAHLKHCRSARVQLVEVVEVNDVLVKMAAGCAG